MEQHLTDQGKLSRFAALQHRDFRTITLNQLAFTVGMLIQELVVAYELYRLTKDPLVLGLIGLAEAAPYLLLSVWGGYVADRWNRQRIVRISLALFAPLPLVLMALFGAQHRGWIGTGLLTAGVFGVVVAIGLIRGVYGPAASSLKPFLLPRELYANGATWSTATMQAATIGGPLVGGSLYASLGLLPTLGAVWVCYALCSLLVLTLTPRDFPAARRSGVWQSLKEGFSFLHQTRVLFWSVVLDLVSVLFGGGVALLPVFADDVLHVGAQGLGFMRAAPAIGALVTMMVLARYSPMTHAWRNMLLAVLGFSLATLAFAYAPVLGMALGALVLTGAFDSVSMVIRQTLLQLHTPEDMRGRVSAINGMFVTSSNELGAFESGATAKLFGPQAAVLGGGLVSLAMVALTYSKTRDLLRGRLGQQ